MTEDNQLFELERHDDMPCDPWHPDLVRQSMDEIIRQVLGAQEPDGLWPSEQGMKGSLYVGASGILWALHQLSQRGFDIDVGSVPLPDLSETAEVWSDYDEPFETFDVPRAHSYLLGPVGSLMFEWKCTKAPAVLDRLHTLIKENKTHPWMENLWGAPSTMVAASHLWRETGEERFADVIREGADWLWQSLERDEVLGCKLWTIDLYGNKLLLLGAGHGFVGNVFPVLRNLDLFDEETARAWTELTVDTVTKTARRGDGMANWPNLLRHESRVPVMQVHHCHGAPGIVMACCDLFGSAGPSFDDLLLAAGELVWRAGPLKKYPGLCHGTPGNGYAFLKLWGATGDEMWLVRAQTFAMAALSQRAARKQAGETLVHDLWEGDMGLVLFLADCLEGKADFPCQDYF